MTPASLRADQYPAVPVRSGKSDSFFLGPALALMAVSVAGLLLTFGWFEVLSAYIERPYLIPWVLATGAVIVAPLVYLKKKGDFSFVNPLVFAAGSYFFPIFFVGGWSLVFGFSNYYYLAFVNDPEFDFPLTFFYIMLGFGALSVGVLIPLGRRIGGWLSKRLPSRDLTQADVFLGGVVFLALGLYAAFVALDLGQIGFQTGETVVGRFGGLLAFLTSLVPASIFLLWTVFFRQNGWNSTKWIILGAQVFASGFMLIVWGNKSSLLTSVVLTMGAFVLVRRKILFRTWAWLGVAVSAALVIGLIYGQAFRSAKGNSERISGGNYFGIAFDTMSNLGDGTTDRIGQSATSLAARLDIASSLAVVVSNYQELQQYEAAYGLENNIWTYTWTAFVPRFLWKDKPNTSDSFAYNELYFDYGTFGIAITSMGDLLRNFGPVGIPIGMFVLGVFLRVLYALLVEAQPFSAWRSAIYFMVLTKVSYDSFYGEILPSVIRVAAVVGLQLVLMYFLSRFVLFRRSGMSR